VKGGTYWTHLSGVGRLTSSVSAGSLHASGIPYHLVASLSDGDMQAIADKACELVVREPIEQLVEFVARLYLAEKGRAVS
jgi:hypothetical protein